MQSSGSPHERPFASLCDSYWANPAALEQVETQLHAILERHAVPSEYLHQLATESAAQRGGLVLDARSPASLLRPTS